MAFGPGPGLPPLQSWRAQESLPEPYRSSARLGNPMSRKVMAFVMCYLREFYTTYTGVSSLGGAIPIPQLRHSSGSVYAW